MNLAPAHEWTRTVPCRECAGEGRIPIRPARHPGQTAPTGVCPLCDGEGLVPMELEEIR